MRASYQWFWLVAFSRARVAPGVTEQGFGVAAARGVDAGIECPHLESMKWLSVRAALLFALAAGLSACGGGGPDNVEAFTGDPLSTKQGYMLGLGVPEAWARERGSIVVAVIDNGVDLSHPDLKPRLWRNPNEQEDGEDNDGNGLVDDIHGWNFLDESSDLSERGEAGAAHEHGTAVAGIIAAETDNGEGIAGLCPGCSLMILKARDFERENSVLPLLSRAVDYAIEHGARVINVSDGSLSGSLAADLVNEIEEAAARAEAAGVVLVASAGNDSMDNVRVPARVPSVLAVAAVEWDNAPADFTSFGAEVDVAAPGSFIYSTMPGGGYGYFNGTSASAPVAAGLAALLLSKTPSMSPADAIDRIRATAKPADLRAHPEIKGKLGPGVVSFAGALSP